MSSAILAERKLEFHQGELCAPEARSKLDRFLKFPFGLLLRAGNHVTASEVIVRQRIFRLLQGQQSEAPTSARPQSP